MKTKLTLLLLLVTVIVQGQTYTPAGNTLQQYVPLPYNDMLNGAQIIQQKHDQEVMNQIQGLKNWYYSQTTHATPIDNSWNTVNATDNYSMCGIRKVYVSNGVVTKYIGRDGYSELPILKTGTVSLGKAVIQLFDSGDFIEIYF